MTVSHHMIYARSSRGGAQGTPAGNVRTFLREGWYVRDKEAAKAPEGIVKGLRRAFPLPASGAFEDLLKAIDVADSRRPERHLRRST